MAEYVAAHRVYSGYLSFVIVVGVLLLRAEEQRRLLDLALRGSGMEREDAYRVLIDDFRKPAMSVICRTLRSAGLGVEHAEEVWQQSVVKFFAVGAQNFRGEASVRTYFVRSALHAAVDVVRLAARTRRLEDERGELSAQHWDGSFIDHHLLMIEALKACIGELSGDHAEAVDLYYMREMGNCAVCATQLTISKDAFMKRLERARKRLEACVRRRMRDGS